MTPGIKFNRIFLSFVLCFLSYLALQAQNKTIDSLQALLKNDKTDTSKVNHYNSLFLQYEFTDINKAKEYVNKALELSKKIDYQKGLVTAYIYLGWFAEDTGNYQQAIIHYQQSLKISEKIDDKKNISATLGNIGNVYYHQGGYPKALDYYFKALKIAEELGDKNRIAIQLGNVGNVFKEQHDYPKALDYYLKGLKTATALGNKNGIAADLGNIGIVYKEQADLAKSQADFAKSQKHIAKSQKDSIRSDSLYKKALDYSFRALKMDEELGDKTSIPTQLSNIGNVYHEQKDYQKALDYSFRALKIDEELEDKNGIATDLDNIGSLYTAIKKYTEAKKYLVQAIEIADSIGTLKEKLVFEEDISILYTQTGNDKEALDHYKTAMEVKDSLINEDKYRKSMNSEFEKKEATAKAEQDKKDAVAAAEKRRQQIIIWSVVSGLLLVILFAGIIFRSLNITRKQKQIIEVQKTEVEKSKHIIEEKNKDITDSIDYAKRIQDAILPPIELIKEKFPNSFVLYKPKDIVAGDFYWMEEIKNTVYIAAADCTGHGVPGAMVSVVCSNALNRAVKEFDLTDTGKILDKITDLVLETFEKSSTEVRDGMDISLLSIKYKVSGTITDVTKIQWSGANNPLWYFQNDKLIEIRADKQPIGKSIYRKPFTTHTIEYKPNTEFYLFTDGYADQFGGPKGRKFMYKRFMEKLTETLSTEPKKQHENLNNAFENWKGNLEQVDDVTVIGIRI